MYTMYMCILYMCILYMCILYMCILYMCIYTVYGIYLHVYIVYMCMYIYLCMWHMNTMNTLYGVCMHQKHTTMADLHNDVTYEGWGKTSMACHRECMGILYPT